MGRFSKDVKNWADKVLVEFEDLRRAIIFEWFSSTVRDSPVATGRLRGNWQISSTAPTTGELEITDPEGKVTLEKISTFIKQAKLGEDSITYLTNSLPYAYAIEYDGVSHTKAPEGMVRKNFIRVSRNLKRKYHNG